MTACRFFGRTFFVKELSDQYVTSIEVFDDLRYECIKCVCIVFISRNSVLCEILDDIGLCVIQGWLVHLDGLTKFFCFEGDEFSRVISHQSFSGHFEIFVFGIGCHVYIINDFFLLRLVQVTLECDSCFSFHSPLESDQVKRRQKEIESYMYCVYGVCMAYRC